MGSKTGFDLHSAEPAGAGEPARRRLLDAATNLFCRYGINATGVDAVIGEAKTAKTTLYKIFGSKEGLIEAVLEQEGERWRDWFIAGIESGNAAPRTKLQRIFPLLKQWFAEERFYGCPFINAVSEHDKADDRMRSIAIRHKTIVLRRIEKLVAEAGMSGPALVAHRIGLLIDGAIIAAMVTKNPAVADDGGVLLRLLLERSKPAARRQASRAESVAV
jgi:AcrR family transcriptional regulator